MFEIKGKYSKAKIFTDIIEEEAISQIYQMCNHPIFQDANICIMPDCHSGAGCTIGTTILMNKKAIIPNVIGSDVGCGVLTTIFQTKEDIDFKTLDMFINQKIPSGMTIRNGKHSALSNDVKLAIHEIVEELKLGNLNKYLNSVGTLGGGNHYIEIGKINENTYALSVHTGSRNLGKKVCEHFQLKATEYIRGNKNIESEQKKLVLQLKNEHREKEINEALKKLKNNPNHEIIGIPTDMTYIEDEDYDSYIRNMVKCQRMAAENRRLISLDILDFLNVKSLESFDTIHNYVELLKSGSIIIRKGAISAKEGERLAIPLNMRDGVIIGVGKGNDDWNQSAPHGAGRLMSRSKAKVSVSMEEFQASMEGIQSWSVCNSTLDESPQAYKPASTIIAQVKETIDIIEVIKPVYNFKSHAETKSWSDINKEEKAKKNQRGIDDESMDTNERDER